MASILGGFAGVGGGSIGKAVVDLALNTGSYQSQLAATEGQTSAATAKMGKGFSGFQETVRKSFSGAQLAFVAIGAVAAGAIVKAVGATQEWTAQVRSLQKVTGQTAEEASKLAAAGEALGLDVSQLSGGFGILAKNIVNGSDNLAKYGIATTDASGAVLPFNEVLANISDEFATLAPGMEQAAFAQNVFGRSGKDLIPILSRGSAGLQELYDNAEAAGLVMSQDVLDASKGLTLAQRELGQAVKGAAIQLGVTFIPIITKAVEALVQVVELVQKVPRPVLAGAAAFLALGAALIVAYKAALALRDAMDLLGDSLDVAEAIAPLYALIKGIQLARNEIEAFKAGDPAGVWNSIADGASLVGVNLPHVTSKVSEATAAFQVLKEQVEAGTVTNEQAVVQAQLLADQYGVELPQGAQAFVDAMVPVSAAVDDVGHHLDATRWKAIRFAELSKDELKDFSTSTDDSMSFVEVAFDDLGQKAHVTAREILIAFNKALKSQEEFTHNSTRFLREVQKDLGPGIAHAAQQMVAELAAAGPQGAARLAALANATDIQQRKIVLSWKKSHDAADTYSNKVVGVTNALKNLDGTTVDVTINTTVNSTGTKESDRALADAIRRSIR